jgi:hypothetical protein
VYFKLEHETKRDRVSAQLKRPERLYIRETMGEGSYIHGRSHKTDRHNTTVEYNLNGNHDADTNGR